MENVSPFWQIIRAKGPQGVRCGNAAGSPTIRAGRRHDFHASGYHDAEWHGTVRPRPGEPERLLLDDHRHQPRAGEGADEAPTGPTYLEAIDRFRELLSVGGGQIFLHAVDAQRILR